MSEQLHSKILSHLKSERYRPLKPRPLAKAMNLAQDEVYPNFREACARPMHAGRVVSGAGGSIMLPAPDLQAGGIVGGYRQNRRGFGFVVPTDPDGHEDLFIAEGDNGGAITGDIVRARSPTASSGTARSCSAGESPRSSPARRNGSSEH